MKAVCPLSHLFTTKQ